jgi:hypothetical protein
MLHREQLTCAENQRAFTSTLGITRRAHSSRPASTATSLGAAIA